MPDEQTVRSAVEERIPGAPPEPHHSHDLHADVEVEPEEGAPPVAELDPEARERRDAALRQVRKFGDPVLRATAVPVERFDGALKREAERMTELMHDAIGVGLAATQLGIMHRVLVYRAYADDADTVLVNPVLERRRSWGRRAVSACRAYTSRSSARCGCACARETRAARSTRSRRRA
jgi:hypothetical protein